MIFDPSNVSDWVLPRVLADRARRFSHRPFLRFRGQPDVTFGDIEARSRRVARGLLELGVKAGDRVLLMLGNELEFVETWFAVNMIGAVLVPVNTAYRSEYLAHVINDSGAALIVADEAFLDVIAEIEERTATLIAVVIVTKNEASAPWRGRSKAVPFDELRSTTDIFREPSITIRDPAAIMYTSGTTGRSKGVVMPHGHLHLNPVVYIEQLSLGTSDVLYTCLPLFHANALLLGVYGALILGTRVAVARRFSASGWLSDIREAGATVTNVLGAMSDFIFAQEPNEDDADNPLRLATMVPLAPKLHAAFEKRFGTKLVELYGSTEVNCPLYHPLDSVYRDSSCGTVVSKWFECRLVDPETDMEVLAGAPGELVVRSKVPFTIMSGYHERPQDTVTAWRNLWFHTGDVMRQDDDGFFYFVDRAKDCIRRRGENISSFEVEEAVRSHPAVKEVAVVGVPSPYDSVEQEVKASIVLNRGTDVSEQAIFDHCRSRMPDFALPRFIEFVDALPKTPTENIRKDLLRQAGIGPDTWTSPTAAGGTGKKRFA
ncbi:MAG: AMP-binding protein [Rhizobiaceae bacterium]